MQPTVLDTDVASRLHLGKLSGPLATRLIGRDGGHPRRSNYADRFLTPAAEGLYPSRKGERRPVYVTAEPWPGVPIRKGNRRAKAADMADATWPNLIGKFKPHDDRHTHATWLDAAGLNKVIQMDRRGHAMSGMDRIYTHVTPEMRQRLCDVLQELWQDAIAHRYALAPTSRVPLLNGVLSPTRRAKAAQPRNDIASSPRVLSPKKRSSTSSARGRPVAGHLPGATPGWRSRTTSHQETLATRIASFRLPSMSTGCGGDHIPPRTPAPRAGREVGIETAVSRRRDSTSG